MTIEDVILIQEEQSFQWCGP